MPSIPLPLLHYATASRCRRHDGRFTRRLRCYNHEQSRCHQRFRQCPPPPSLPSAPLFVAHIPRRHAPAVGVTFTVDKIMQPAPRKIKRIDARFTITGCVRCCLSIARVQLLPVTLAAARSSGSWWRRRVRAGVEGGWTPRGRCSCHAADASAGRTCPVRLTFADACDINDSYTFE